MSSIFNQILRYDGGLLVFTYKESELNLLDNHTLSDEQLWQDFWQASQSEQKLTSMLKSKSSAHQNQLDAYLQTVHKISMKVDKMALVVIMNKFVDRIALEHKLWPEQLLKLIWEGFYITEQTLDKNYQEKDYMFYSSPLGRIEFNQEMNRKNKAILNYITLSEKLAPAKDKTKSIQRKI